MARNKQTLLKGRSFDPVEDLSKEDILPLLTAGAGPGSRETLLALGWNEKVVGTVTLWLSNDNASVARGVFSLAGVFLPDAIVIPAKKLWHDLPDSISLSVALPSPDVFSFPDSLVSDYVDDDQLPHFYFFNNSPDSTRLSEEDISDVDLGNFCVRLFIYPASATYVFFSVLIFPLSSEDLKEHALSPNPKWPGLLLCDGQLPLFPPSARKVKWGAPFLPLVVPGAPFQENSAIPPSQEFRAKLASIMRGSSLPETKRNGEALLTRWASLDRDGAGALDTSLPPVLWPAPQLPPTSSGSFCLSPPPPLVKLFFF